MNIIFAFTIVFIGIISGCTSVQLQYSTLAQGRTLTDLQYQIVLDNVAMFREAPGSLPWHLKITQGSITINDALNPSFSYASPPINRTFGLAGSRAWQEGWTVVPVVNPLELSKLKTIYEKARTYSWIKDGAVPGGFAWGRYAGRLVWVGSDDLKKLTELTLEVLAATAIAPAERAFQLPGPVPSAR